MKYLNLVGSHTLASAYLEQAEDKARLKKDLIDSFMGAVAKNNVKKAESISHEWGC